MTVDEMMSKEGYALGMEALSFFWSKGGGVLSRFINRKEAIKLFKIKCQNERIYARIKKIKDMDHIKLHVKLESNCQCVYCGKKFDILDRDLTIDHIIPTSKGGDDEPYNMVACCKVCNSSKSNNTIEWWRTRITLKNNDIPLNDYKWFTHGLGFDILNDKTRKFYKQIILHKFYFETIKYLNDKIKIAIELHKIELHKTEKIKNIQTDLEMLERINESIKWIQNRSKQKPAGNPQAF